MKMLCRLISSCLYLGELPASGTWGSLVGWVLAWYFFEYTLPLFAALCVLGYALTLIAEESFGSKDPSAFVLDEVCGMMLAVLWLPKTVWVFAAALALFRLFDIWKPWPISILQKMKHPFSIMHDDLAAGLFANLILQAALRIFFK
jgi:phosphatidylglycerophosphatase A